MTITTISDSDPFQQKLDEVASRVMQGKSDLAIARDLGIKRVEVLNYKEEWRKQLANDTTSRDAARDHLNQMVEHYNLLIDKSYKVLDDLDNLNFDEKVAAQKNATLKNISDYESKRVDALQKAGILDGADLGDELADMEEKQRILIDILQNELCPDCRKHVLRKLSLVTGYVEGVVVSDTNE